MGLGMPSATCVFSETWGNAPALEHNGDPYVYPEHRLENIHEMPLRVLFGSEQQRCFDQETFLPRTFGSPATANARNIPF